MIITSWKWLPWSAREGRMDLADFDVLVERTEEPPCSGSYCPRLLLALPYCSPSLCSVPTGPNQTWLSENSAPHLLWILLGDVVFWRECPRLTSIQLTLVVISMFGWWEKRRMFLRFICLSSEVWNSQPCHAIPGFNKDSELRKCIAHQAVYFLLDLSQWHVCHRGS